MAKIIGRGIKAGQHKKMDSRTELQHVAKPHQMSFSVVKDRVTQNVILAISPSSFVSNPRFLW